MPTRCAYNLTRLDMHYRHDVFSAGLRAAGYGVRAGPPAGKPGDVLLIWNRYGHFHDIATRFERAGGTVLIAENGYIGRDENGGQFYALARHAHNGAGHWPVGGPGRWAALGVDLKPWRSAGEHILVCGQRGIGMPGVASPPNWHQDVARRLACITRRPVRIRQHPGKPANDPGVVAAMQKALEGAHACVVWSSANGVRALVEGVPVICEAPFWICKPAALPGIYGLDDPLMSSDRRLSAMQRLAWAQWTLAEIASGEPFRLLADLATSKQELAA